MATMVLKSVNVFDVCCKKTLLTWTVLETHDDTLTVSIFYETVSEERYRAGAVPFMESRQPCFLYVYSILETA